MPWVFLGKSPLLTGKCIISSYTDSACNQIHKVQLCKQLVPSDTSEWKPWYQKQRKMREVQTTYSQMSQHTLIVVAKEVRVKSVKPKAGLWRAPGQESNRAEPVLLPARTYLVWTEDSQILVAHTEQEKSHRKPAKKKKKKKKPAKTQEAGCVSLNGKWRTCLSQKWVCLAWLPYCSTRKTVNLWLLDIPMNITVTGRKTWQMQWALGSLPSSSAEGHPRLHS